MSDFRDELLILLNKHSIDNACGTPDYVLADFIVAILKAHETEIKTREDWLTHMPPAEPGKQVRYDEEGHSNE